MLMYCRLSSRNLVEQVVHAREYVHGQPWYFAPALKKTGVPYPFSPVRCRLAPRYYTYYMLIYCRLSSRNLVEQDVHAREYVDGQAWFVAPGLLKKQGVPYSFSPVRCRLALMYYTSYMLLRCTLFSQTLLLRVVHAREYVHGQPCPALKKTGRPYPLSPVP